MGRIVTLIAALVVGGAGHAQAQPPDHRGFVQGIGGVTTSTPLLPVGTAPAQTPNDRAPARNSVYLELLGNGGPYSVNFERRVSERIALRAGFASWSGISIFPERSLTAFPVLASFLPGSRDHRAEVGAGVLVGRQTVRHGGFFGSTYESSTVVNLTATLGYRYQRPAGRFVFRAGFTPFYSLSPRDEARAYPDKGLSPSVGVSFGYAF
jgi:hypothetical protein